MGLYFAILMQTIFLGSCIHKSEPETYLIPKGFQGRATIIFNQKLGVPSKYENGRRVYEMPLNGILLSQCKDEYGIIDHQYYYVDSSGKKASLPIYKYEYNEDGTTKWTIKNQGEVGIYLDGTTGQYGGESEPGSAAFQLFIVSGNNRLDSFFTKEYQKKFEDKINKFIGATKEQ